MPFAALLIKFTWHENCGIDYQVAWSADLSVLAGGLWTGEHVCVKVNDSIRDITMPIIVASVMAVVAMALLFGGCTYMRSQKQSVSWKISLDELKFPVPHVVLGSGTFGQVRSFQRIFLESSAIISRTCFHLRIVFAHKRMSSVEPG